VQLKAKSFSTEALVLSHRKVGETDRITTLLTQSHGKLTVVAKGVRKMTSSKKAALEPGNIVTAFCIETKSMPILTQTRLHSDCMTIRHSLQKMRQLQQLLEIVDRLFVNEELEPELFDQVISTRNLIVSDQPTKSTVLNRLDDLLVNMGYLPLAETKHQSILDYVAEITERPMKSWAYLTV
jgi:DNA repair protein RecO (recombination protein O)